MSAWAEFSMRWPECPCFPGAESPCRHEWKKQLGRGRGVGQGSRWGAVQGHIPR